MSVAGKRGPLKGAGRRLPGVAATLPVLAHFEPENAQNPAPEGRKPLPAPKSLGPLGRKAWRAVTAHAPLLDAEIDAMAVERFCRLIEEREEVDRVWQEHGPLLKEPLISPRGEILGERLVANPAAAMLRALDKELDELSDRLALTAASRARLGLTVTSAQAFTATAAAILGSKYRTEGDY